MSKFKGCQVHSVMLPYYGRKKMWIKRQPEAVYESDWI